MVRAVPGVDVISAVRREISAMDTSLTPFNARSMAEQIAQFMSALKAASWTYGLIGVFGLILASVGLAGVTAYSVAQRSHEIGIRMALGADRSNVLGLVLRGTLSQIGLGLAIGIPAALAGGRVLASQLYGVNSYDPVILGLAAALLAACAILAASLPARSAARVDPVVALRFE